MFLMSFFSLCCFVGIKLVASVTKHPGRVEIKPAWSRASLQTVVQVKGALLVHLNLIKDHFCNIYLVFVEGDKVCSVLSLRR
jgi:uncharacterized membrane protein YoaK (UPF0700 family)